MIESIAGKSNQCINEHLHLAHQSTVYYVFHLKTNDMFCFPFACHFAGFVSFNDQEIGIAGNAGLKDQTMALKWVKENCSHFGGDPENISE